MNEVVAQPKQTFYGDQFNAHGVQTRINASSLAPFKQCPRKYELDVLRGRGKGEDDADLRFGTLMHAGKALYEVNKARGLEHSVALQGAFRYLLHETWNTALNKPDFLSDPVKNRNTLLRTFVWYCEQYKNDPCETYILPSGKPAVELGFEFPTGLVTATGETITFVGTLDRIVRFNNKLYIMDLKTSTSMRWLSAENYSPNTQFSLYVLAGWMCFDVEVEGIILDGIEVSVNGARFHREIVPRPKGVIEEWAGEQHYWIERMLDCTERRVWPQNDATCGLYGGCPHRKVCSASPSERGGLDAIV